MSGVGRETAWHTDQTEMDHIEERSNEIRKRYATQTVCGICGKPVDFSYRYPHPLSPCIDHIMPINKGGHPSDIDNLQLAHWTCNRQKSDKIIKGVGEKKEEIISNRVLPHTFDWKNIRKSAKR